jgi:hypothetical protein
MSGRTWLIAEDAVRDPTARALFDAAVAEVDAGTAVIRKLQGESILGFVIDGQKLHAAGVLAYRIGIGAGSAAEFEATAAWTFAERMRLLLGWNEISSTLRGWVDTRLRNPYFVNEGSGWQEQWVRIPGEDASHIPESYFDFACRVAIGELKHGPSFASISAGRIFDWVSALGSNLPARLKKHGSGTLPAELARFSGDTITAAANDALAVIRVTIKEEKEGAYHAALVYLARLLTETDFPRSYAIEFRGPTKSFLPIKGLPKKGVHQLFACAAAYPELHPLIALYARAAIRAFEWYENLEEEDCAMPGTFAVFALGMAAPDHAPLVLDYLREVDGEHQSMQEKFVEAYVDAHGFTPEALAYFVACAGNIQHLRHRKTYPALIANGPSLEALLALRGTTGEASGIGALRANLLGEPVADYAWRAALFAIWGERAEREQGRPIIDTAPSALRPLYQQLFA